MKRDETYDDQHARLEQLLTRRTLLRGAVGLAAGVTLTGLLAACGGDDDDDDDDTTPAATTATPPGAAANTPAAAANTPAAAATNTTAATAAAASPTAAAGGEWTFVDDAGNTITLPKQPERVVALVNVAAALWDYGVRPIGVFGPTRLADGTQAPQAGNIDLDQVESAGETFGEIDVEKLVAMEPDLIVTALFGDNVAGDPEGVLELVADTAPTLLIQMRTVPVNVTIERFEELAGALGADLASPENVANKETYEQAIEDLTAAIAEKPGLIVMFTAAYPELLYVANPPSFTDLLFFKDLGLDILTPDVEATAIWEELSWEQANKHEVDLILNDARQGATGPPEEVASIPTWAALPAVVAGQVGPWYLNYIIPSHLSYEPVLEEMTEVIRDSDPDIV